MPNECPEADEGLFKTRSRRAVAAGWSFRSERDNLIVSGNSSSGVLATTVDVLDSVGGTLVPITLDLLWAAVDPSTHDSIRDHLDLGGVTVITTSKGIFFNAVVSGSVTTPLGQFGPEPPLIAQIGSQTSGSVTLIR